MPSQNMEEEHFKKMGNGEERRGGTVYTHINKCKNDKIRGEKNRRRAMQARL
jgi:hypothetical protein